MVTLIAGLVHPQGGNYSKRPKSVGTLIGILVLLLPISSCIIPGNTKVGMDAKITHG